MIHIVEFARVPCTVLLLLDPLCLAPVARNNAWESIRQLSSAPS